MGKMMMTAALAALFAAAAAPPAQAGETEYGGTFCSHSKSAMLQAGPDVTALNFETWGIQTPDSPFKPWANATNRCAGNMVVTQGKAAARGECLWTDADGDTFIGSFVDEPGKPVGVWTFLGGTGKWKGVSGSGTYQYVSSSPPRADGTGEGCTTHSGRYTLP
jgi:hypothetical protein